MLNEVYGDTRLRHMWRSFDFNFGQPSVVLVRVGDRVVHSSVSDNRVPQGHVLYSVGFAKAVHPAYVCVRARKERERERANKVNFGQLEKVYIARLVIW